MTMLASYFDFIFFLNALVCLFLSKNDSNLETFLSSYSSTETTFLKPYRRVERALLFQTYLWALNLLTRSPILSQS